MSDVLSTDLVAVTPRYRCRWRDCPGNHRTEGRRCKPPTEKCGNCGGHKKWCFHCFCYTATCCVEYGTCQCN